MKVSGNTARKVAREFVDPRMMDLGAMEAEVSALLEHEKELASRPQCTRRSCTGKPHVGHPYPHSPKRLMPRTPLEQAQMLDPAFVSLPHVQYLSNRLTVAMEDVFVRRKNRFMVVSMPPRSGKSELTSVYMPAYVLNHHPDWKIGLLSHSPYLATSWGRRVRGMVEDNPEMLGTTIAPDAGAASNWETSDGGQVISRSIPGQKLTGLGFKVIFADDLVASIAAAHSKADREAIWNSWQADVLTRLEGPYLVVVVGTRWHEDDIIGRLLNPEFNVDMGEIEVIRFPAVAEENDVLGREPGDPLFSPVMPDESREDALARWQKTRRSVGEYVWSALYQQRPSPSQGSIFDMDQLRFWTKNPEHQSLTVEGKPDPRGKVVLFDPAEHAHDRWLDSWDCTFKGTETSDFVVGQRWVRSGPNRYLIAQQRGRWNFTETLARMNQWSTERSSALNPYGSHVHERHVEEAANGAALIEVMKDKVAGVKPINPRMSKEARARAVTPEIETGNVFLPNPSEPGNEWVNDLLSELRNFPNDVHDDQVDALTQALNGFRQSGTGSVSVPGGRSENPVNSLAGRSIARTAASSMDRRRRIR